MSDRVSPFPDPSAASCSPAAVVFAGGDAPSDELLAAQWRCTPPDALVVAADSGLHTALRLGLRVDVVVGDLDSVAPSALDAARAAGARIDVHPVDKDATDLELALAAARDLGARRITVVSGDGGRHDHLLANALVLAADDYADLTVDAVVGTAVCTVVRDRRTLHGTVGSLCTLLPIGGTARGVTTTGLRFPLRDEDLHPGSTRGVSNELAEVDAGITLRSGVLLAVQPHALAPIRPDEERLP